MFLGYVIYLLIMLAGEYRGLVASIPWLHAAVSSRDWNFIAIELPAVRLVRGVVMAARKIQTGNTSAPAGAPYHPHGDPLPPSGIVRRLFMTSSTPI